MVSRLSTASLCIIISLGLTACGTQIILQPTSTPSATATVEPTEVPTTTFTPEPTATPTEIPTPTIEPTKTANQMAEAVGLDVDERSYVVETREGGTYLVDTYNKVPKAVMNEDGSWRKLDYYDNRDAETMYGWMTPVDSEDTFRTTYRTRGVIPYEDTNNLPFMIFYPIYTGDWVQRETVGPDGEQLILTYLVTTWRDDSDGIRVMEVGVMAEAPDETFDLTWACRNNENHWDGRVFTSSNALLDYLPPGQDLAFIEFPFLKARKRLQVPDRQVLNVMPWVAWEITNSLPRLAPWLLSQSSGGHLTEEEARLMNMTGIFTDRVLVNDMFYFKLGSNYEHRNGGCP